MTSDQLIVGSVKPLVVPSQGSLQRAPNPKPSVQGLGWVLSSLNLNPKLSRVVVGSLLL